jgi:hypothetical protein
MSVLMLRGLGLGNPIMSLKNASLSGLAFETVSGRNPSRFLLIRFFSSTVNRAATGYSKRYIVSKLVTKHSFLSSQNMQLIQILFGGRSSKAIGLKNAITFHRSTQILWLVAENVAIDLQFNIY